MYFGGVAELNMSKETSKTWNKANKERCKEANRRWEERNPRGKKASRLKQDFGINLEIFDFILECQDNKCAICDKHKDEFKRSLDVDHDHKENQVRGLLCNNCNRGLGHFFDNIKNLKQAISYLELYNLTMEVVRQEGLNATKKIG